MGPTASGKTNLAIELVKKFPFEIISVDSVIVYRDMDIGSAKPSVEELKKAPHHLINIRDPKDAYSAADFRCDALQAIEAIFKKGKIPLLVGGTMLYFKALLSGLSHLPSANLEIRSKLLDQANKFGWQALHKRLKSIDPDSAAHIHPNDVQRIQRALEVFEIAGKTMTQLQKDHIKKPLPYESILIAIAPKDRAILHERIEKRVQKMLHIGLIEEVRTLYERGDLHQKLPVIRSVGYRQVWAYLEGKLSFEEMQQKIVIATRQLAKRQLTWLRRWPNIHWFNSEAEDLVQKVEKFLTDVMQTSA